MFLALGVGAWSAAIFHFMIHAFFKALLFLVAGSVILLLHEEHDMHKMGGLRKKLPLIFITFLIGGASLSALPLITAGFYSKDEILWYSLSSAGGNKWLWLAGITGALITSLYTFRMIFLTFFGKLKIEPSHKPGILMGIPLVILAFLSLAGGFIQLPENFGHVHLFSELLSPLFPDVRMTGETLPEWLFQVISATIALGGVWLAYVYYYKKNAFPALFTRHGLNDFFYGGWGFDKLYDRMFVRPVEWISAVNKNDILDKFFTYIALSIEYVHVLLARSQNGKLRVYALVLTAGLVIVLILMLTI
jgi:NADH-quinone oxidoreductase subunit L